MGVTPQNDPIEVNQSNNVDNDFSNVQDDTHEIDEGFDFDTSEDDTPPLFFSMDKLQDLHCLKLSQYKYQCL